MKTNMKKTVIVNKSIARKITSTACAVGFSAIILMASSFASAEYSSWYMGANVGQSNADFNAQDVGRKVAGASLTANSITSDDTDTGYKLFGGYQFNEYFALEGGYFNLGESSFTINTTPAGRFDSKTSVSGFNLDAVAIWPIADMFSMYGRFGVNYAEAKNDYSTTGIVTVANSSSKEKKGDYKYGIGFQFKFSDNVDIRVEGERYRVTNIPGNKDFIDLASVGLTYRFAE